MRRRANLRPLLWEDTIHLPIDEVYTRLEIKWRRTGTFQLTNKDVHMYEIFNLKKQDEQPVWYQRFRNMFHGKGTREKARMVLLEGSPGIGKTTFCLKLAYDWATKAIPKKFNFPVFQPMLLLKCRDMDGDVFKAIYDQLLPSDTDEKKKKKLRDFMRDEKNQEKILLILDGLDELPQKAEQSVDDLLRRKVLSRCSIVATTRQEKGIEVRQRYDFDILFQIYGFTISDASTYIRKYFKLADPENLFKGENLIKAIDENIFLHALRNNPLNLLLLCLVFQDYQGELPSSRTKLYQIIVQCLLKRSSSRNGLNVDYEMENFEEQFENCILALGELAWKCLQEDRHSFLKDELNKLEGQRRNSKGIRAIELGLIDREDSAKKINPQHQYCFLHKTFQEFLAARYLAHKMLKEHLNIVDFYLNSKDVSGKYRQVFLFVAGLLDKEGAVFFKEVGQILQKDWKWHCPNHNGTFLMELLKESGAADDMALAACSRIGLPKHLVLNCSDWLSLRVVRYALEGSLLEEDVEPLQLAKLSLTKAHNLSEDSANDLNLILQTSKVLKDLSISTDLMTYLLVTTLSNGIVSNSSISTLALETFKSIPPEAANVFGQSLSSSKSLTTVALKLFNESSDSWASAVNSALSTVPQLTSVVLEIYGILSNTAVLAFKSLLSNASLISLSLIVYGNMEDYLTSALSEGLLGQSILQSLALTVHGRLSNSGAAALEKCVIENRTLQSLTLKVHGEIPKHWATLTANILALKKAWSFLALHPHMNGNFANAPVWILHPVARKVLQTEQTLTLNVWGEFSCDLEALGDYLLKSSSLSSFTLNVHSKINNDVADCLVKFLKASKVLSSLTINLWGEITSCALERLREHSKKQPFNLNMHGLETDESGPCVSEDISTALTSFSVGDGNTTPDDISKIFTENKSLTEMSLTVHNYSEKSRDWGHGVGKGLKENSSLTAFSLTVHNYTDTSQAWGEELGKGLTRSSSLINFSLAVHGKADDSKDWEYGVATGLAISLSLTSFSLTVHNYSALDCAAQNSLAYSLAMNKSLTSFSLTVHSYADLSKSWGHDLGNNLAESKSLTEFNLTVYSYADLSDGWGRGLGDGLAKSKSLTTFSFTVQNYAEMSDGWGHGLGDGLAKSKSLTTFSLTVQNYAGTSDGWGYGLAHGLAKNASLTSFCLTVHNYANTIEDWGYGLGQGLAKSNSLTTFSLNVHNYADTGKDWGCGLGQGLAKSNTLTTFSLTVHNYADINADWGHGVVDGLSKIVSLTTFNLTIHNYPDTNIEWGHGVGERLANIASLTTLSLTVHNYASTPADWGCGLGSSVAKSGSISIIRLEINNHSKMNRDFGYNLCKRLAEAKSLASLSVSVSLNGDDVC